MQRKKRVCDLTPEAGKERSETVNRSVEWLYVLKALWFVVQVAWHSSRFGTKLNISQTQVKPWHTGLPSNTIINWVIFVLGGGKLL